MPSATDAGPSIAGERVRTEVAVHPCDLERESRNAQTVRTIEENSGRWKLKLDVCTSRLSAIKAISRGPGEA